MVDVGVNECDNTVNGRNQFVFLVLVHLLLIGLNGTNGNYDFCKNPMYIAPNMLKFGLRLS